MGRTDRFDRIYEEHATAVLAYALRRCDAGRADDVLSDVFLTVWRRLDDVPVEPRAWLLGVARRVLSNQHRALRRQEAVRERLRAHAPTFSGSDLGGGDLAAALEALSERDRELLLLIAWDGLSPQEAADVLGIRAGALSMRLSRARARLRVALAESDGAHPPFSTTTGASS